MSNKWEKNSWKSHPILQQPKWEDEKFLNSIISQISDLPALVYAGETRSLIQELSNISQGEGILIHAGDCAEEFANCTGPKIHDLIKIILQMSIVISYLGDKKVLKTGRMAGQYAKPRSSDNETIDGITLPSYRGDMINSYEFNKSSRKPSPERILEAYYKSASTLNLVRAFTKGGYASLDKVASWDKSMTANGTYFEKYHRLVLDIKKSLKFLSNLGFNTDDTLLNEVDFYVSHEALLLPYEEALTRIDTTTGNWYCTSAHFLWVGERTRSLDGAHVEFLRGIGNPIGIKIGPSIDFDDIPRLHRKLNPSNIHGKITLITRFGADKISEILPNIIKSVQDNGLNVVWCCDPMHGNTIKAKNYKTRVFDNILKEISLFWEICQKFSVHPGGVHLELTRSSVTECIGGEAGLTVDDLPINYSTNCDPRLNADQALEMAFKISNILKGHF